MNVVFGKISDKQLAGQKQAVAAAVLTTRLPALACAPHKGLSVPIYCHEHRGQYAPSLLGAEEVVR